jgi:hypothetical protein
MLSGQVQIMKQQGVKTSSKSGLLKETAMAIGGAAGTLAALAVGHQDAASSSPAKKSGKLPKKNKSRLPRREKKELAKKEHSRT